MAKKGSLAGFCCRAVLLAAAMFAQLLMASNVGAQDPDVFFSSPVQVSHNASNNVSYGLHAAFDSRGDAYVVWVSSECMATYPHTCKWHLYFSHSVDGTTFSDPKDISNTSDGDAVFGAQIAVDRAGNVNVVWEDTRAGGWEIFFSRSADRGRSFSQPRAISNKTGFAVDPQIALVGLDNIYLAWQAQDFLNPDGWNVWLTRSGNAGETFSEPTSVCQPTEICTWPKIAAESSGAFDLVWAKALCVDCAYDVFVGRSANGGASVSTSHNLSYSTESLITAPDIVIDRDSNVNVIWAKGDSDTGNTDVFFSRSTDHGMTFTTTNVSGDNGRSYLPNLAADDRGDINLFWLNDDQGGVLFSRSTDGGANFSTPKKVSSLPGPFTTSSPFVAVAEERSLNLVWQDNSTGGVLFSRSTDGGTTFSTPQKISSASTMTFFPQITADTSGNMNVLWFDEVTGNQEIVSIRGVTFGSLTNDIAALSASGYKNSSRERAVLNALADVEVGFTSGDVTLARIRLEDLVRHTNGCGTFADPNDWIIDCAAQLKFRTAIEIISGGLLDATPTNGAARLKAHGRAVKGQKHLVTHGRN